MVKKRDLDGMAREIYQVVGEDLKGSLWIPSIQIFIPMVFLLVSGVSGTTQIVAMVGVSAFWTIAALERVGSTILASNLIAHLDGDDRDASD